MRRYVSGDTGEEMATLECFYVTYFIWKCWNNKCVRSPVQKLFLVSKLLCHLWFENIPTLMWRLKSLCSLDQSRSHNMRMGPAVFLLHIDAETTASIFRQRVTWWLWTPVCLSSISGKSQMSGWLVLLHLPYLQCIHTFAFKASWPIIQPIMALRSTDAIWMGLLNRLYRHVNVLTLVYVWHCLTFQIICC